MSVTAHVSEISRRNVPYAPSRQNNTVKLLGVLRLQHRIRERMRRLAQDDSGRYSSAGSASHQ